MPKVSSFVSSFWGIFLFKIKMNILWHFKDAFWCFYSIKLTDFFSLQIHKVTIKSKREYFWCLLYIVHFNYCENHGVKEIRFRGDTLLTGVLLLERVPNGSAEGVSIWSLTCEICLSRAFPSSRAYRAIKQKLSVIMDFKTDDHWLLEHSHWSRSSAEHKGPPRHRACFWNNTDPDTAELCSPPHAPVVPDREKIHTAHSKIKNQKIRKIRFRISSNPK